jgi:hypothetical protein
MTDWIEANQQRLAIALAAVAEALNAKLPPEARVESAPRAEVAATTEQRFALDAICTMFGLSPFARDVLLLCAGIELDSRFGTLCAALHGDPTRMWPTFSLALATLPGAHWSALTPAAPLRRWRLVELGSGGLTTAPLRIDERVLHYLCGINELDARLDGAVERVTADDSAGASPSIAAMTERVVRAWTARGETPPPIQLTSRAAESRRAAAIESCARLGFGLLALNAASLPAAPAEADTFIRLLEREAWLSGSAVLLDCEGIENHDAARWNSIRQVTDGLAAPLFVGTVERRTISTRVTLFVDKRMDTGPEQRRVWSEILGDAATALDGELDALAAHFALSPRLIRAAVADAKATPNAELADALWVAAREQSRPAMSELAQRIEARSGWPELVIAETQARTLREIAVHVRHRATVYERWGFGEKQWTGLGVTALFAGPSGTGKTLAAEVLANDLKIDLYRIDLSQVVSKYIGETEKNLRRLFDAAEDGGAILLFDEADALFGKRSEVKDSHDRYANIEVSYLLQRMEAYRGLAILTTNHREALDPAFLRRIRFIVQFPFPGPEERAEIWRRVFPPALPAEGIDVEQLARLSVTGGNIRNIALGAAFRAAAEKSSLRMSHLLEAARRECAKLDRAPTDAEVGGWL